MITLSAVATEDCAPERLDRVALALFATLASGSQVRKLARKKLVTVDGVVVGPMSTVRPGQVLEIALPPAAPSGFVMDVPVVYVDDWMAVVDKPAGLVTSGPRFRTLAHALARLLPPPDQPDAMPVPHPVHRLDARTRGLVVVARTHAANVALGRAFQERLVQKRYRALVRGALHGEGVVDLPIGDRDARSRWRTVSVSPSPVTDHLTTLDLWPETGRTHQLRRHVAQLGHPVLGDTLYTTDGPLLRGQGLMLAAVELRLPHPITGAPLHIELPEPDKFVRFRERAERRAAQHAAAAREDLWVFGYGSLVWRPAFPFVERHAGRVSGMSRRFWQGSTDHRGVPGAPGRVATLVPDPDGVVHGMVYRVAAEHRSAVLAQLDHREQGGYARLDLDVDLMDGTLLDGGQLHGVMAWVATPDNPNWLGPASAAEIAATVQSASGPSGDNVEYLAQLQDSMHQLGVHDPHLDEILALVQAP